jgi:hypothetical protein
MKPMTATVISEARATACGSGIPRSPPIAAKLPEHDSDTDHHNAGDRESNRDPRGKWRFQ